MMKKNIIQSVVLISFMSSSAFAQFGPGRFGNGSRGNGPRNRVGDDGYFRSGPRLDFDFNVRTPGGSGYCDRYRTSGQPVEIFGACTDGSRAAIAVAEKFAGDSGRMDGYFQGYSWGLQQSVSAASNDTGAFNDGSSDIQSLESNLQRGLSSVSSQGQTDGSLAGSQEARSRFSAAMGSGVIPSRNVGIPSTSYLGEANAYDVYVGLIPSAEDLLRRDRYQSHDIPIYGRIDGGLMKDRSRPKMADIYHNGSQFNSDRKGSMDGDRAFDIFVRGPFQRQVYDRLSAVTVTVYEAAPPVVVVGTPPVQPDPAQPEVTTTTTTLPVPADNGGDGQGGRPGGGRGQGGPGGGRPGGGRNPSQAMVAVQRTLNLQNYFKEGFKDSYAVWADYHYRTQFKQNIDDGYREGVNVGSDVGYDIAYYRGQRSAFNSRFLAESRNVYTNAYSQTYSSSFNSTFDQYANNSILSVNIKKITEVNDGGKVPNGVIEAGELVSIDFELSNEGGVPAVVTANVSGNVVATGKQSSFTIPALKKMSFSAPEIARIDGSVKPHTQAQVTLVLDNRGQKISSWMNQMVLKMVELVSVQPKININGGNGQMVLTIRNNGNIRTSASVIANLSVNGAKVNEVNIGAIEANTDAKALLTFSNVDPMSMISSQVQLGYNVLMNSAVIASDVEATAPLDVMDASFSYFDSLWNHQGWAPPGSKKADRVASLTKYFIDSNMAEAIANKKNDSFWANPAMTVIGKAAAHGAAALPNSPLRLVYHDLGGKLYPALNQIPKDNILFVKIESAERKAYKRQNNILSIYGDYEAKNKPAVAVPVFTEY